MDIETLPTAFTHTQALQHGLSDRSLANLTRTGELEHIARGIYARPEHNADEDLLEIALRNDKATLCLTSALAHWELTDEIPASIDIALPRGTRQPQTLAPVRWHSFATETFTEGRETIELTADIHLGIYSSARTIIDMYRNRRFEGTDAAHRALRTWLTQRGNHPSALLAMAKHFPRAMPTMRTALETLL